MKNFLLYIFIFTASLLYSRHGFAQQLPSTLDTSLKAGVVVHAIDSAQLKQLSYSPLRRKINELMTNMRNEKIAEYTNERDILNKRIATYFLPFEGKTIRNIYYRQLNFNVDINDTTRKVNHFAAKVLLAMHTLTKDWVIKQNMFIKKGDVFNPFIVADNERYLRTLNFLHDARILVHVPEEEEDSLDLYVITKDLFSLSIDVKEITAQRQYVNVGESNLFGTGQSLSVTGLADKDRDPKTGINVNYSIQNILNSFVGVSLNAGNISRNQYDQMNNLSDYSLSVQRPLYSQYASFIGNLTIGKQKTDHNYTAYHQDYKKPVYEYINYEKNYLDATIGYNINPEKYILDNKAPDRNVVMARYFNHHFIQPPDLQGRFSDSLTDQSAILFQYTYFKQYFYKSSYILGFGATEDMPYGVNISVTSGYHRQLNIRRPYLGVDFNQFGFTKRADIIQYFFRAGTYYAPRKIIEDLNFIGGISAYGRLIHLNNVKWRQRLLISYAQRINAYTSEPLRINNIFGLNYFREDSIIGEKRFSLRSESVFFMPRKILGIAFAPFLTLDVSALDLNKHTIWNDNIYYSVGGGIRVRNENLQFKTVEFRLNYLPKKIAYENQFKFTLTTNLRFRYNSNYVTVPRLVEYNSDIYNNVY